MATTQPPATITAGSLFGMVVTAEDAQGNVDTSFTGAVTIASDAGNTLKPLQDVVVKRDLPGPSVVLAFGLIRRCQAADGHAHGENVVGTKAAVGLLHANQAMQHQTGTGQQQKRKRGLAGDQSGEQTRRSFSSGALRAAQRRLQIGSAGE